ncbi:MAG: hypothetical protein ACREDR_22925, partial [Blastocatellia bacterium]
MATPGSFPNSLNLNVYRWNTSPTFPEFSNPRYNPKARPIGVCISGGGCRSFSAAIGQMRGLLALGFQDLIGAVSTVSGGTWFGSIFNYAPGSIDDKTLLGPVIDPENLTLENVTTMDKKFIGNPILGLTNSNLATGIAILKLFSELGLIPQNRIWSRLLNNCFLINFDLANTDTFFSLDRSSVDAIVKNNPSFTPSNFYTLRANRPYFIAGGTQVFPSGQGSNDIMRRFEYTPLYSGTPQFFRESGPPPEFPDFGGGFVQSFGFDSTTPSPGRNNLAVVPTPNPIFLLSDVMGSSSAAIGAFLDQFGVTDFFPEFNYWPPVNVGKEPSELYSFVDGGDLENTGIVPLLWRQYPIVYAFVNSSLPIGSSSGFCVDGID